MFNFGIRQRAEQEAANRQQISPEDLAALEKKQEAEVDEVFSFFQCC